MKDGINMHLSGKSTLEAKPLVEREWLANREREKGNDLFKAKEFSSSLKAYTKAITMYKDSSALYVNRATVHLKMHRHEEAYSDCSEALKLDPRNLKALMRRAKASLEMNEPSNALIDLHEALKFDPTSEEALSLKRNIEDGLKKHSTSDVIHESPLSNGRRFAIEEIQGISTEIKQHERLPDKNEQGDLKLIADDWRAKGNAFFAEKNFRKACECYSKSLTYVPEGVLVLCNRSLSELRLKNYISAEMDASKALAIDSHCVKAFHHRGLARRALGKLKDAIEDLQEVLRAVPGEKTMEAELEIMMSELNDGQLFLPKREGPIIIEEIHEDLPQGCRKKNCFKDNFSHLQTSRKDSKLQENPVAGSPNQSLAHIHIQERSIKSICSLENKGSVLNEEVHGDTMHAQIQKLFPSEDSSLVESTKDINEEIQRDEMHVRIQECSSISSVQSGKNELDALQSNMKTGSSQASQTTNREYDEKHRKAVQERLRGNNFYKSGDFTAAIDCYNKSLELDQMVTATYTNRALCHLMLKEPEKAIDDCTQAILLEPKNSKAYFRRATSRKQIKNLDGALEDYQMFLGLHPNDESVKALIKEVQCQLHGQMKETGLKEQVTLPCDASANLVESSTTVSKILENPNKWRTAIVPGIPKSAVEFERSCLDLLPQPLVLKEYIQAIKTSLYPRIFKEDLTAKILKLVGVFVKENILLFQSKVVTQENVLGIVTVVKMEERHREERFAPVL